MTVNLLSQRLKAAKRELTALKTAHRRGLGSLAVYEFQMALDVPVEAQTGFWYLDLTLTFDRSFPAYPFAQVIAPNGPASDYYTANIFEGEQSKVYGNSGYSLMFTVPFFYSVKTTPYPVYFYSTAPIVSITPRFWRTY